VLIAASGLVAVSLLAGFQTPKGSSPPARPADDSSQCVSYSKSLTVTPTAFANRFQHRNGSTPHPHATSFSFSNVLGIQIAPSERIVRSIAIHFSGGHGSAIRFADALNAFLVVLP
jgi:hypothetical protein